MRSAEERFRRLDQQQQFDEVLVHRPAGGLHDETIRAAHVFLNLQVGFAVRKLLDFALAEIEAEADGTSLPPAPGGNGR